MAITTLSVQQIDRTGLTPSFSAANSDGSYVANDGKVFIEVKNSDTSDHTVTIATPNQVDGLAIADLTVTVPASGDKMIGPFPPSVYNNSSGYITVTYSSVTGMTVAAFRL